MGWLNAFYVAGGRSTRTLATVVKLITNSHEMGGQTGRNVKLQHLTNSSKCWQKSFNTLCQLWLPFEFRCCCCCFWNVSSRLVWFDCSESTPALGKSVKCHFCKWWWQGREFETGCYRWWGVCFSQKNDRMDCIPIDESMDDVPTPTIVNTSLNYFLWKVIVKVRKNNNLRMNWRHWEEIEKENRC